MQKGSLQLVNVLYASKNILLGKTLCLLCFWRLFYIFIAVILYILQSKWVFTLRMDLSVGDGCISCS